MRYFFERYFKYLLENGSSALTKSLEFSREIATFLPRFPALPLTLILSCKNFSKAAGSMTLSPTGWERSMVNLATFFAAVLCVFYNPITKEATHKEERMKEEATKKFKHFFFSGKELGKYCSEEVKKKEGKR